MLKEREGKRSKRMRLKERKKETRKTNEKKT